MKTAYPQIKGTCSIRLYSNIPFDNTYKNHSLISELFTYNNTAIYNSLPARGDAKERFLNRRDNRVTPHPLYYPRYDLVGDFNFDFSNGLLASVVLELTPEQTNANYLRLTCGNDVYYYFVTGITQNNFDTYTLSLELDVLMTYQDEFLKGMKDVPVFTKRKHCHRYTNDGLYPHCADLKKGDSAFAGIKPSLITKSTELTLTGAGQLAKLSDIKWLYICVDDDFAFDETPTETTKKYLRYNFKDITHPLTMIVVPLNMDSLTLTFTNVPGQSIPVNVTFNKFKNIINLLVNNGKVHGAKISSYPPFILDNTYTISKSGNDYTITTSSSTAFERVEGTGFTLWKNEKTKLYLDSINVPDNHRFFVINEEYGTEYSLTSFDIDVSNEYAPDITQGRKLDPKLLFSPFKKYLLTSSYSNGNELYPELIYSDGVYMSNYFDFATKYNFYIGDYSIFTYQKELEDENNVTFYSYYLINNVGLSSNINYVIPCGTNALDVFNTTQANTFYQSKVASGITSGLSIAGGIASIGVGVAFENPMLIAGGATAIAGGTTGIATTIKSYNAKIEDLKNTPDAINVQGGSFVGDFSRTSTMPYISEYECSASLKEQADDYFYNYGYEVGRECYFNTELYYDNDVSNICDNNLMGRTIFNYIELQEDITNKINANIPMIIKQKISRIFNEGITLWSFYGNGSLWGNESVDNTNDPDKWFMKCILDNTEYSE